MNEIMVIMFYFVIQPQTKEALKFPFETRPEHACFKAMAEGLPLYAMGSQFDDETSIGRVAIAKLDCKKIIKMAVAEKEKAK